MISRAVSGHVRGGISIGNPKRQAVAAAGCYYPFHEAPWFPWPGAEKIEGRRETFLPRCAALARTSHHYGHERVREGLGAQSFRGPGLLLRRQSAGATHPAICRPGRAIE